MELEEVANVMVEYGSAVRGDWGSLDGRTVRGDLESLADAVLAPAEYTVESLRQNIGICPDGMGHWTDYCDDGGCKSGD